MIALADIAQSLLRAKSVTPDDGTGLDAIVTCLEPLGFSCEIFSFSSGIKNLWAVYPSKDALREGRHFAFCGHSDVVPSGDETLWRHPPFAGVIEDDILYGRGAVDMKGAIACFIAAAGEFIQATSFFAGGMSLFITGDEEGDAEFGIKALMPHVQKENLIPDVCLIGEPSSKNNVGDTMRIGRRGSLYGTLITQGTQGHSAYPEWSLNPILALMDMMNALLKINWRDESHLKDERTILTPVYWHSDGEAGNVIPARAEARFNVRFHPSLTGEEVKKRIHECLKAISLEKGHYQVTMKETASPFLSKNQNWTKQVQKATQKIVGKKPVISAGGGTSDGRFIAPFCPVAELGLVGTTMHSTQEAVPLRDLTILRDIYRTVLMDFFNIM